MVGPEYDSGNLGVFCGRSLSQHADHAIAARQAQIKSWRDNFPLPKDVKRRDAPDTKRGPDSKHGPEDAKENPLSDGSSSDDSTLSVTTV